MNLDSKRVFTIMKTIGALAALAVVVYVLLKLGAFIHRIDELD